LDDAHNARVAAVEPTPVESHQQAYPHPTGPPMTIARAFGARFAACCAMPQPVAAQAPPVDRIRLPAGFMIDVVARAPGVRQMTFGASGTLFAGSAAGASVR
jgi:hypothetical protein